MLNRIILFRSEMTRVVALAASGNAAMPDEFTISSLRTATRATAYVMAYCILLAGVVVLSTLF